MTSIVNRDMTPLLSAESDTISFWEPPSTRAGHLSPRLLVAAQKKIAGNLCFYTFFTHDL